MTMCEPESVNENGKIGDVKMLLDKVKRKTSRQIKMLVDQSPILPKHPPKVCRAFFMDKLNMAVARMNFNLGMDGFEHLDFTMKMNELMFDLIYNDMKLTDEDLNRFLFNTEATTFSISQKEFEFDGKSKPFGFIRMSGSKFQKTKGVRKTFHQFFWIENNELRLSEAHVIKNTLRRRTKTWDMTKQNRNRKHGKI